MRPRRPRLLISGRARPRARDVDFSNTTLARVLERRADRPLDVAFSDVERARLTLQRYARDTGKPITVTPEEMADFVRHGVYAIKDHRHASLAHMVQLEVELAPLLLHLNWFVLHAPPEKTFITSDNPFVLIGPHVPPRSP